MHAPILRLGLLALACLVLPGSMCLELPECPENPTPVQCEQLPECRTAPACSPNGVPEICDNGIDDNGNGLIDDEDPACVQAPSPVTSVTCIRQTTTTTAGADSDTTDQPDGCDLDTHSESGSGDASTVTVNPIGEGVFEIVVQTTDTDPFNPPPTATISVTIEVTYEPGGSDVIFSVFDASPDGTVTLTGECESEGYTIPAEFWTLNPTSPPGGAFSCDIYAEVSDDAEGVDEFRILAGANVAPDTDQDGVSNRNDKWCPDSTTPSDECGCEQCGTYAFWRYFCPDADQCFDTGPPNPFVCDGCSLESEISDTEVTGIVAGHSILIEPDGSVRCDGCKLTSDDPDWSLECPGAECFLDPSGAIGTDPLGGEYFLEIDDFDLMSTDESGQLVVDSAALLSDDPLLAEVAVETTDEETDLVAEFVLETDGRSYERDIETQGGVGLGHIQFVFDFAAEVTWNATPGWEFSEGECADIGSLTIPTAALFSAQPCLFTVEQVESQGFHLLTQTGLEAGNLLPSGFGVDASFRSARAQSERLAAGGAPAGERFAVAGANGVGVYEADNLSLVPSLSTIGGFQITNVLGSLWLDAPNSANDAHWYYKTPSGTGQTQWFPEISGFGATQISFAAVRDATYVDGDPNGGRAVYVAAPNFIGGLFFEDLGYDWPVLSSSTLLSAAPAGFTPTSAFQTSASGELLFAARSNPAGTNGRLFRGSAGNSPVAIGDLGVDPRLLRCASAVAGTWICVAASFGSAVAHVATWNGGDTAAVVGSFATGANPLVPAIAASGSEVLVGVPNFGDDSATLARLDGATGAVLDSGTQPVPVGCTEPSSALLLQGASKLVITCHGTNGLGIIEPVVVP